MLTRHILDCISYVACLKESKHCDWLIDWLIDRSTYFKDNPFKSNNEYFQTLCLILASKGYMTLCYYAFKTQHVLYSYLCQYISDSDILGGVYPYT